MGSRRLFGSFLAGQKEHRTFRNNFQKLQKFFVVFKLMDVQVANIGSGVSPLQ
jgi:hypothetical protein